MPLTEAEQKELKELKAKKSELAGAILETPEQPPDVTTGLSPEEQQELQQLKQRRTEIQQQQIGQEQKVNQLFEQLRGFLPEQFRAPTALPISPETRITEPQRQKAFDELQQMGFTPEQIRLSLQTQKKLETPSIGRPIGGIGGALAATAVTGRFIPGPIDDIGIMIALIAAGGAGVGGIAGEAIQTGIEEKRLISKREALKAFAIEAGTELGGRAVVRVGKFALSPFIKKTVPEAASLINDFAKVGGQFSPTELDKRFSLQIAEAFSRGGFGAKQIFQEFEEKQGKAVLAFADNIIESIGEGVARQTPQEIGAIFTEGITRPGGRVLNILDDLVKPLYSQVDELAKGAKVSTKGLKAFARKHLATDTRLNKQFLSPVGRSKLTKVLDLGETLDISDMRLLRSSYLKDVRKLARDVDQSQGLIKQLASITDDAIFDPKVAQGLSPEALNLLRNTNALYRVGKKGIEETFSESLTKRLLKNPSRVVKELFPNNNPKAIRLLRKSLVEPISGKPSAEGKILWNQLRQSWVADAVDQATKEGIAKPKVFDNLIRKLGSDAFKEMFPEKQIAGNVKRIQSLFDIAGKVPPTGVSLFSRGAQVGGLALMYKSGKEGDFIGFTAGATLAIGPLAFAKLAVNPRGVKLLTVGFRLKPGASGLVPNAVRMIRLLREINQRENKQRLNELRRQSQRERAAREPTLRQLRGFGGRGF